MNSKTLMAMGAIGGSGFERESLGLGWTEGDAWAYLGRRCGQAGLIQLMGGGARREPTTSPADITCTASRAIIMRIYDFAGQPQDSGEGARDRRAEYGYDAGGLDAMTIASNVGVAAVCGDGFSRCRRAASTDRRPMQSVSIRLQNGKHSGSSWRMFEAGNLYIQSGLLDRKRWMFRLSRGADSVRGYLTLDGAEAFALGAIGGGRDPVEIVLEESCLAGLGIMSHFRCSRGNSAAAVVATCRGGLGAETLDRSQPRARSHMARARIGVPLARADDRCARRVEQVNRARRRTA